MKNVLTKTQISKEIDKFLRRKEIDKFLRRKDEWRNDRNFRHGFYATVITGYPTWTGVNELTSADMFSDRMMALSMNYSIAEINANATGNWIQFILTQTDDYSTNIDGDLIARICDMYEEV